MTYDELINAAILAKCVQHFNQMERCKTLIGNGINYQKAEELADFCSQILGKSVPVSDVLLTDDDYANQAIEEYDKWRTFADNLDVEAVKATCKRIFYDNDYWFLRMKCDMEYPYFMGAVIAWKDGAIGLGSLLYHLQDISLWSGERKPTNIRTFAKQMIKLLRLYEDIVKKRNKRKEII